MSEARHLKVLFVCLGNICRSPSAEGVFRHMLAEQGLDHVIETDSAGTHAYHVGNPPDQRSQIAARKRGVDIGDLRARQVNRSDFEYFDYVLAMDRSNLEILLAEAPERYRSKVRLFLEYASDAEEDEVPDPYYGGDRGFEHVLDLIGEASSGLLAAIRRTHQV
ncbi:low molecular weight protein-tyrosine-phosphatase [Aquisalimonas asiatica]|uniref:protein-tyrosine-phosphatase n=1 Tax=Aquisalimonas asiatica TaxID=406100 RepID=A0A1H8QEN6_9GAMM|nr:low molecular weight protein-tyrosine-phosphatase [Aquisalimonas asiatica]SEO52695.1 protein tyrosine phosphatase [Aquisalimonas asiatica]